MSARTRAACIVAALGLLALPMARARTSREDEIRVRYIKYEYRIAMRDGVRLFTSVYVPKDAGAKRGPGSIALVRQSVSIPVIAIGGINHANVADVMRAGADGAAVISAVLSAPDIKQAAAEMVRIIREATLLIPKNRSFPKA